MTRYWIPPEAKYKANSFVLAAKIEGFLLIKRALTLNN